MASSYSAPSAIRRSPVAQNPRPLWTGMAPEADAFAMAERSQYEGSDARLDRFFAALSDATRRRILILLAQGELPVNEIVENFRLSQPTISQHLGKLREVDLVVGERRGQYVFYRISDEMLVHRLQQFFAEFESCERLFHADLVGCRPADRGTRPEPASARSRS